MIKLYTYIYYINSRIMSFSSTYFIRDNVIYTSNCGYDRNETPYIPLSEFLEDCMCVPTFKFYNELCDELINNEVSRMPSHFKELAMKDINDAKRLYLKNVMKKKK